MEFFAVLSVGTIQTINDNGSNIFFCYYLVFVCTENCKKPSTEKLQNGIFPYLISQYFGVH